MGWLGRLFGRETKDEKRAEEVAPPVAPQNPFTRGWNSRAIEPGRQETTTHEFFEALSSALALDEVTVVRRAADEQSDLRGKLRGFPLKIMLDWNGDVRTLSFKCVEDPKKPLPWLNLTHDAQLFDPDDEQVMLVPGIYVEGDDADEQAAAFRKLPSDLQERVLEMMRADVFNVRSTSREVVITLRDRALKYWTCDPAQRLQHILSLAAEMQLALGAKPLGRDPETTEPKEFAAQLAKKIAAQRPGAEVVERDADSCFDIRWIDGDVPMHIALDYRRGHLDIAAQATDVAGNFFLYYDEDEEPEDEHVAFTKKLYMDKSEAAFFRALGKDLVDEVIATADDFETWFSLREQLVETTLSDLDAVTDDGAAAFRVANLLARVAAALPRG
jgi:hypothetical protein